MKNDDMAGRSLPGAVTAVHEVGHVVALLAAGLSGEFESATVGAAHDSRGAVAGLTHVSFAANQELVRRLTRYATDLGSLGLATAASWSASEKTRTRAFIADYTRFCREEAPRTALRYLCYYFGGGSIERSFQLGGTALRERIDRAEATQHILPALQLDRFGEEDFDALRRDVDAFLVPVFRDNADLVRDLVHTLEAKSRLDAADVARATASHPLRVPSGAYAALERGFLALCAPRIHPPLEPLLALCT